ncbi:CLUMA_CG016049, isoform A [Clunio marinus]|uniref:CLUMA_CG016049, isoform A n=1 Tax=Clunio marinus TaxID=568069 RepID=A0A1J1ISZ5_9DIPT|nr:CLUMA_CG016049, isoform A [Clunio marinus]
MNRFQNLLISINIASKLSGFMFISFDFKSKRIDFVDNYMDKVLFVLSLLLSCLAYVFYDGYFDLYNIVQSQIVVSLLEMNNILTVLTKLQYLAILSSAFFHFITLVINIVVNHIFITIK